VIEALVYPSDEKAVTKDAKRNSRKRGTENNSGGMRARLRDGYRPERRKPGDNERRSGDKEGGGNHRAALGRRGVYERSRGRLSRNASDRCNRHSKADARPPFGEQIDC